MGWMESYGLFVDAVPPRDRVRFERIKLAETPIDLEAAEIQHAFEERLYGMRRAMVEEENARLGELLKRAAEMPCGILVVTGTEMVDDGDSIQMTAKTLMGFHPSVPCGQVQYITGAIVDWDLLQLQLLELGGEHGGEADHGEPDDRRRGEG